MKPITQSRWIHGLSATFGIFSQPDGTVPRLSNLLTTKRGSLTTCGGSQLLAQLTFSSDPTHGNAPMWLELFLYQVLGGTGGPAGIRQIYGLLQRPGQVVQFIAIPMASELFPVFDVSSSVIFTFNIGTGLVAIDSAVGGVGGGGGGFDQGLFRSALGPASVPVILQFTNLMVLCLGSETAPYTSNGTTAGTTTITNTFSAQYPTWQANVSFPQGSLIQAFLVNSNYLFKATQGGVSGGSTPAFTQMLHTTVVDGTIIWQNIGAISASPAPRGAAHGISYAGSLWLANTSAQTTADGLDGLSAIRMSDINSPNSWNPLNAAQLGRDDGTEITGLASFTIAEIGISPTGSLIVFKQFSTYQIIGVFGSTNLTIQPLQTDLGCIAPRSIVFLPSFGVMRLSHLGFAITNGVVDKLACEEIRPYLFGGTLDDVDIAPVDWNWAWFSKAAQTADPPMYVCACPVIGGVPLQTIDSGNVFVDTDPTTPSSFGGQDWYVRLSAFGPSLYEWGVTPEFGPFAFDLQGSLRITLLNPPFVTGLYVYLYQKSSNGQPISGFRQQTPLAPQTVTIIPSFSGFSPGNPPTGIVGALTRLFCFDLVLKAWAVVDLPWPISVLKQFRMHGSIPITVSGGFIDQSIRRLLTHDTDWDGQPITWSVRGREVYGEGGSQELFMRRMIVRGFGQTSANTMIITPSYDGGDDPAQLVGQAVQVTNMGANQFEVRLDLQRIARNVHVNLVGQGQVEILSLEYEVEPCEVGAPIVIA